MGDTLDIIGAGFGRTGTASLKAALEHLGFGPTYHMFEVLAKPTRMVNWARALDGEPVDWHDVFAGYSSTVDWPGTAFWRELCDFYPEAKVILTVRDPQRWYESTYNTIYQIAQSEDGFADELEGDEHLMPAIRKMIWDGTFDGRFHEREHAIDVFERHNEQVRRTIPADRLLVYQVNEGWGPLCEFLGVDVPDTDFPHVNDSGSLPGNVTEVRKNGGFQSPLNAEA